jgi:hypothetical protein
MRVIRSLLLALCMLSLSAQAGPDVSQDARKHDASVAAQLSELTTLSINPVLVGGYRNASAYYRASPQERLALPWTAQPWFWGTLLFIGIIFLVNNLIGDLFGPVVKKFMSATEVLEGKLLPLYATPMVIPVGIDLIRSLERSGVSVIPAANAATTIAGTSASDPLTLAFGAVVGLLVFGVIWLSNQAFHTLVLLCPIPVIDSLLRLVQLLFLGFFLGIAAISPVLGAGISVLLILVCAWIAGWSFRLSLFGTVFAWDLLWVRKNHPAEEAVLAFSAAGINLPARTMGRLHVHEGKLELVYRPWLVLPAKRVAIPERGRILTHGILYTQVHRIAVKGEITILTIPPRYRGSEVTLARFIGCGLSRPSPLKSGMAGAVSWIRSLWARPAEH